MCQDETPNPDESNDFFQNAVEKMGRKPSSLSNTRLLSEQDVNRVKDKFDEDVEFVYEEAIARHRNIQSSNVPTYFWILFAFFAYDNVLGWLSSPLLFYPLVVVFACVMTAY